MKILNENGQIIVLNSKGERVTFGEQETKIMNHMQRTMNELGYDIDITSLTAILKTVSDQKFFQIAPADYMPVVVGEGAWSQVLTKYRSFSIADDFSTGLVNTGGQNGRLAVADGGVDSINIQVYNWAKTIEWTLIELQQAAKAGNWDIVTAKEKARKMNWDLGIQKAAFLGVDGLSGASGTVLGLLNQPSVNVNTTRITKAISSMTPAELKVFCAGVVNDYRANCNRTAWPTHFAIPESDYLGLASQASADFPIKSTLQLLEEMFQTICRKPSFKILPLAYADAAYHADFATIVGKQVYSLYAYDEESLRMSVPVDYTNTLANSMNNFSFESVGYGQFTGVMMIRPLEMLYFQY